VAPCRPLLVSPAGPSTGGTACTLQPTRGRANPGGVGRNSASPLRWVGEHLVRHPRSARGRLRRPPEKLPPNQGNDDNARAPAGPSTGTPPLLILVGGGLGHTPNCLSEQPPVFRRAEKGHRSCCLDMGPKQGPAPPLGADHLSARLVPGPNVAFEGRNNQKGAISAPGPWPSFAKGFLPSPQALPAGARRPFQTSPGARSQRPLRGAESGSHKLPPNPRPTQDSSKGHPTKKQQTFVVVPGGSGLNPCGRSARQAWPDPRGYAAVRAPPSDRV